MANESNFTVSVKSKKTSSLELLTDIIQQISPTVYTVCEDDKLGVYFDELDLIEFIMTVEQDLGCGSVFANVTLNTTLGDFITMMTPAEE